MTHNMKQFVIDGQKCVLNKPTSDQKVEDGEFEENEVYAVDIVVSTGALRPFPLLAIWASDAQLHRALQAGNGFRAHAQLHAL